MLAMSYMHGMQWRFALWLRLAVKGLLSSEISHQFWIVQFAADIRSRYKPATRAIKF